VAETGPAQLAFAARLAPAAQAESAMPSPAPDAPVTAPNPSGESAIAHPVQREHKPEPAAVSDRDASPERQDWLAAAPAHAAMSAAEVPARNDPRPETHPVEPPSPRPAEPANSPALHPPAAGQAARDIRLELAGAGRRVEVRLEERAGEVRVSVRTPDGALAETLRDHLPALSARLEQSGFRADQWRAADALGDTRPIEVLRPAGGSVTEGRQQHAGGGGEQAREQSGRQREPRGEGQPNRNQKGKSFAWLMSALE
jgi:hypothetical protein